LAVRLDLEAYQGDNYHSNPIQFLRGDTPLVLTNLVGYCQVRNRVSGGLITELNVVIDDATNGRYHLEATAAIMALFPTGGYTNRDLVPFAYDVQWTGTGNYKQTTTYGTFYIRPEVTK
jgi:hypothetical protein